MQPRCIVVDYLAAPSTTLQGCGLSSMTCLHGIELLAATPPATVRVQVLDGSAAVQPRASEELAASPLRSMRRRSSTDVRSEDSELVVAARIAAAEWQQQVPVRPLVLLPYYRKPTFDLDCHFSGYHPARMRLECTMSGLLDRGWTRDSARVNHTVPSCAKRTVQTLAKGVDACAQSD